MFRLHRLLLYFSISMTLAFAHPQSEEQFAPPNSTPLHYLLALPEGYSPDGAPVPLLLFLHGGGESGFDLAKVKRHGPPKLIEAGQKFPFIVVSPQNPGSAAFWDEDALLRLLDHLQITLNVDSDRIYLTGLSRGGYGAWRLALENPHRFAAFIPISGAAPSPYAGWLKDLPTWVFHGALDPVIPVTESERMVAAIHAQGGNVKLTVYPDSNHDAWTATYDNPEIYRWLLQHRLSQRRVNSKPEST